MTVIPNTEAQSSKWRTIILITLAFWVSGSLLLDLIVMPTLYATGMMAASDFATTGYSVFWIFNRIELLCAALALTGVLVVRRTDLNASLPRWVVPLSVTLLALTLLYTYALTPEMSSLGLQLNAFESSTEVPAAMNQMHMGYWLLELFKFGAAGALLGTYYNSMKREASSSIKDLSL
ncbi:hypothetical protein [Egbenema bharatensis]|uniref:hypothetical protein n=1 Tax=Egbenema bharatensis TaxID=3463334 RepID=UPI003A8A509B